MSAGPPLGAWLHSYEEDTGTTSVYRHPGHPFRPSRRMRRGMEFRADGTYVGLRPGPDDRPRQVTGRWRDLGGGRIRVVLDEEPGRPFELTVLSCAGGVLTLAR
ncbi:hypothetical protein HNP84_003167 [Thermocatellispora tengchongensis]|uniref:Uncharacterized protein n=1 Tax=Thermocatellispora tengchongensis TaxID=1073253 RepID=A0A840P6G4_9ACTN|nr:hypothetical protein [Thermocatellispora tengchongensis]MBB5133441.1 hypothetical protein [Thermocatellispora tengchongensis]